jgi:hypothetical protein
LSRSRENEVECKLLPLEIIEACSIAGLCQHEKTSSAGKDAFHCLIVYK